MTDQRHDKQANGEMLKLDVVGVGYIDTSHLGLERRKGGLMLVDLAGASPQLLH